MTSQTAEPSALSAECAVAQRPEYRELHGKCRQTKDVPLIHGGGILLTRRCGCSCHRGVPTATEKP